MKAVLLDCLKERPTNVLEHILTFCKEKKSRLASVSGAENVAVIPTSSLTNTEMSETDPHIEEKIRNQKSRGSKVRMGISAEAYGVHNQQSAETRKTPKSLKERADIRKTLLKNFTFKSLTDQNLEAVIDAMEVRRYDAGQTVIRQGENGSELLVVFRGTLVCTKQFPGQKEETFLRNYQHGESFGELALMYNTPRAATVVAKIESMLFSLDRHTFNSIVRASAMKYRVECRETLIKIPFLKSFSDDEIDRVIDCLENERFDQGVAVVKQGDTGDKMYFILSGTANVAKEIPRMGEKVVGTLGKFDFFGEIALLKEGKREATVRVTSPQLAVASLDKAAFKRLFGAIEGHFVKHFQRYQ
jgi:cAMP-dependent protein kinase regulator